MNLTTSGGATVEVADDAFSREFNETLVHQVVVAYMAGGRQGSKAQKTRSQVRGGGRKPWRQKGTGRARAGTIRSPIWRGGGVAFAASPRNYEQKVNRKMYRAALSCIVSELVRQERLTVVDEIALEAPKTALLKQHLDGLGLSSVLIVTDGDDQNVFLAARNLPLVDVVDVAGVDPVAMVRHENVLMTVGAVKLFEESLA